MVVEVSTRYACFCGEARELAKAMSARSAVSFEVVPQRYWTSGLEDDFCDWEPSNSTPKLLELLEHDAGMLVGPAITAIGGTAEEFACECALANF
jgi:hypothetical protein